MIRAAFFDAGNTLLKQDYARIAGVLAGFGLRAAAPAVERAEHRSRLALDGWLRKGNSTESEETKRLYRQWMLDALDPEGTVDRTAFREALRAEYRRRNLYSVADADALEAVRLLRSRGVLVGVISNADGTLEALLEAAGLKGLFPVRIDSTVVGVEKPDPRIFRMACEAADVLPEEAAHIGDLPSIDPEPAGASGLSGWLYDPGNVWTTSPLPRVGSLLAYAEAVLRA